MRSPEIPSSILLPPPIGFDEVVVEGKGKVLQRENEVFYNRPQVVNRDLSLAIVREFQKRRKEEHENDTDQKTRRGKGMYNKVPRESKIIAHLVSEREREHMFATKETTREHPATSLKPEDDEKEKAEACIEAIEEFFLSLGISTTLSSYTDNFEGTAQKIAERFTERGWTAIGEYGKLTPHDVEHIVEMSY